MSNTIAAAPQFAGSPDTLLPNAIPSAAKSAAPETLEVQFLRSFFPAMAYLNDESSFKMLLHDVNFEKERQLLADYAAEWLRLLTAENTDIFEMERKASETAVQYKKLYRKNRKTALETTREMETAWKNLNLYCENSRRVNPKQLVVVNATPTEAAENTKVFEKIEEALQERFDTIFLSDTIALVAIPGWLGSRSNVEKMAMLCRENGTQLLTDFMNLPSPESIIKKQESEVVGGFEAHWAAVILYANWLIGRKAIADADKMGTDDFSEKEALFLSPAVAAAGRLAKLPMYQPFMGVANGKILGGVEARFQNLRLKKEINKMALLNLNPITTECNQTFAFNESTCYNGNFQLDLSSYPVVRVKNLISKALKKFLNLSSGEVFNDKIKGEKLRTIVAFLEALKKTGNIRNFKIVTFERNKIDPLKIILVVHFEFQTAAKSFTIELNIQKPDSTQKAA